jgi:hypothetical protein
MTKEITIHSYANGGIKGSRPRAPMVHILASDDACDVQSITFHPDDAYAITFAIIEAAKAAEKGLRRKPVTIELKPQD